ncbi:organic cation transporter protein-like [Littorina saxatilis]|uniref:Major facilitator superfamily (MFS) profile domain-containing protein n=1 Tax=Littorina saxatilis TaxID=31220 RepID=A0AAN9B7L1_9CAEN
MEQKSIDPALRALDGRGRYQWLQVLILNVGAFGAAFQLLDNIFIGRAVTGQRCAGPDNTSVVASDLRMVDWNDSHVTYGKCEITVSKDNLSGDTHQYPCPYGYEYDFRRELSFRTEFDLVCDRNLLGGLVQTLVIFGQGCGAVLSSICSDRFGRKPTLIASQLGLLGVGMAIGLAPNYAALLVFKFLVGGFQQGVVGVKVTMAIELFPKEYRSVAVLMDALFWGLSASVMALPAFLLRDFTWRYLQYALSAVSALICLLQLWYIDESLRWLVANGKKDAAVTVLERAARVNRKDFTVIVSTLDDSVTETENSQLTADAVNGNVDGDAEVEGKASNGGDNGTTTLCSDLTALEAKLAETLEHKQAKKLTLLDIFRHRTLFIHSLVTWLTWFTCAFAFFALYMMSTTLHGNRFLNYFLTAAMELPTGFVIYFILDRVGRKTATRGMFILAGVGLIASGIFRVFTGNATLGTLSVVTAMLGMLGASGIFALVFFFTPELFPTNMRNQALGVASFAGRLGGMLAPFMTDLADIAIWAPGVMIGSLCFVVVVLFRFIPETRGRELPHTIEDIEAWEKESLPTDDNSSLDVRV